MQPEFAQQIGASGSDAGDELYRLLQPFEIFGEVASRRAVGRRRIATCAAHALDHGLAAGHLLVQRVTDDSLAGFERAVQLGQVSASARVTDTFEDDASASCEGLAGNVRTRRRAGGGADELERPLKRVEEVVETLGLRAGHGSSRCDIAG